MNTSTIRAGRRQNHRRLLAGFLLALAFALLFVGRAQAQTSGDLDAHIPFGFHVGNTKLPAGDYRIRTIDDSDLKLMEISSVDGSMSALFDVEGIRSNDVPANSELIFNKYGDQYFLSKLFNQDDQNGNKVVESRYEKRVSANANGQATVAQEHVPARRHKA